MFPETGNAANGGPDTSLLARLKTALWIYDFGPGRIVWANPAALRLWDAESLEALSARNMRDEMSVSVATRLDQHCEDFRRFPDREVREFWTLYPNGVPSRVDATLRRCSHGGSAICMLVEARVEDEIPPENIRSTDALLYSQAMIALFNRDGVELYANPAFRNAFGPGEHFFGRAFVSPADLLDFLEGLKSTGEHRATVRVHTLDGEAWHDIHATRCRDAATGDGAFAISATDVTVAHAYQQELSDARDLAEAATRMKSVFLNSVGHEMRTPLNGIIGLSSILADCDLAEDHREMAGEILDSGEKMLSLVENVLDLVTIDAGTVTLKSDPFDPSLLVTSTIGRLKDRADQKGLRVIHVDQDTAGTTVKHDADRIGLALFHLISNAIKFTDRGIVAVRSAYRGKHLLRFEVADTGIGIGPDHKNLVFSQFYQVDSSLSRDNEGLGLGLTICQKLVELWGGEIGFDSDFGRGSVFWFTVPLAPETGKLGRGREEWRVITSEVAKG